MDITTAPMANLRAYYNGLTPFQVAYLAFALAIAALNMILISLRKLISQRNTPTQEEVLRRLRAENLIELPEDTSIQVTYESSQGDHTHCDSLKLFTMAMSFAIGTLLTMRIMLYVFPEWHEAPPPYVDFLTLFGFSVGHLAAFIHITIDCLSLIDNILFESFCLLVNWYRRSGPSDSRTDELAEQVDSDETLEAESQDEPEQLSNDELTETPHEKDKVE
ncbi:uncharacterized protein FTOL_06163 [Fusarium torulosum]|uniref:Uncharacterized protein n=1 Tax=Fusarium torulosum TaxID=33205 RepID=A0AAE8M8K8_9HYPO|nr:uncharacterized protein FTOL_06163 [Fusarium torulosum]